MDKDTLRRKLARCKVRVADAVTIVTEINGGRESKEPENGALAPKNIVYELNSMVDDIESQVCYLCICLQELLEKL